MVEKVFRQLRNGRSCGARRAGAQGKAPLLRLLDAVQLALRASSVQLSDDLAEVEGRARQAVEAGNDEGVAFRTYSRQDFSGGRRSVTLLLYGNHLLAVLEFAELDFEALPDGAHLGVADAHPCWWDGFIIFKAI